ncbi:MAG: TRAP transporter small permease [Desulfobacterales bacterium]|nr:TRAP transporter small permease [Desulfobacterales bacterium]
MKNILERMSKGYIAALLVSFAVIIICVVLQIVTRYVLNQPLTWTEEVSLFAFCWFTFLGAAACSWEDSHLAVDFFYNKMGKKVKKIADICIMLLVLVMCGFMIVDAVIAMKEQIGISSVALRIPIPAYTAAIFIGFVAMALFTIYHLIRRIRN